MNLAQALGAAAAALVMAMSASGMAPAQTMSEIAAEARARLSVMHGAAEAVVAVLAPSEAFPEPARHYGEHRMEAAADLGADFAAEFEWNAADSACVSARRSHAERERVEMLLERTPWRDLPDAKIHIGRRMARL